MNKTLDLKVTCYLMIVTMIFIHIFIRVLWENVHFKTKNEMGNMRKMCLIAMKDNKK